MELSPSAVGLWTLAGSWCADYLTDGFIRKGQIRRLGGGEQEAEELVAANLWIPHEDGWQFRDWTEYQPTAESVKQGRDDKSRGGKLSAHNRWHKGKGKAVPDCEFCDNTSHKSTYKTSYNSPISDAWDGVWDRDTPVPEPVPEVPKGTSRGSPPKKSVPLPDSWEPTPEHKERAQNHGLDINREAEQFRLHAQANGRTAKNWNAAFTMWLNKSAEWNKQRPQGPPVSATERAFQRGKERHDRMSNFQPVSWNEVFTQQQPPQITQGETG